MVAKDLFHLSLNHYLTSLAPYRTTEPLSKACFSKKRRRPFPPRDSRIIYFLFAFLFTSFSFQTIKYLLSNIIKHTVIFIYLLVMLICLQIIELVTSTNYERKSDVDMVVKIINYKIIEMVILFLMTLSLRINYNCGELIPS